LPSRQKPWNFKGFRPMRTLKVENGAIAAHELGVLNHCIEFSQNGRTCKCCSAILRHYAPEP
jgi:hypothetical protein